jgi:hypothetical protein
MTKYTTEYKKIVGKNHGGLPFEWWLTFEDGTNGWSDLDVEIGGYLAYDDDSYEYYMSADDYASKVVTEIETLEGVGS